MADIAAKHKHAAKITLIMDIFNTHVSCSLNKTCVPKKQNNSSLYTR